MIISTNVKTKCDVYNCKNDAAFYFSVKGKTGRCYLCSDCFDKLTADARTKMTPKSPKNTIKRIIDNREKERNYGN